MDRNWRSIGFPDSPELPDAFRFLSYFAPKTFHAMRQDRVMFNDQVYVSSVTLVSLVQSGEDYMRNLSGHAKEYDKSFTETPLNVRNVNVSNQNLRLEDVRSLRRKFLCPV